MKGVLIAYTFAPQKTVGALRPTYWAEEICNHSNIELDVVTATPTDTVASKYARYHVENKGSSIWSFAIKDEGLTWRKDLEQFFIDHGTDQYDFALITGGPFFHFSIGKFLKKRGLKIIYDFRDPFSYNPRHEDKGLKRMIKERFERKCLEFADLVLTVNDACHEYIGQGVNVQRGILPNGFDERILTSDLRSTEKEYDFFYGGKFYWEPRVFFYVLDSQAQVFCHAGTPQNYGHPFEETEYYKQVGLLSQKEMYQELAKAEIGLVFTIDVPFESTTKIYDYLALGKKILIITKGEPHKGVLKRELEGYPMYRWVKDDRNDIQEAIRELSEMEVVPVDTDRFSRKAGLLKLIDMIQKVCNG